MAKKTKKRKSKASVVHMSPEKYIKTKSRSLPIYKCHISDGWQDAGTAMVLITRRMPSGHLIMGIYLVDTLCLGVKDTLYRYNATLLDYQDFLGEASDLENKFKVCKYALAHNVIYGAVAFAEDLGFSPHKDFLKVTQYVLEEDDDRVEFMDLDFGHEGEPVLMVNPEMIPSRYIRQLNQSVGEGNYQVVYGGDAWNEEDDLGIDMERPFRSLISARAQEVRENYVQQHGDSGIAVSGMEVVYEPMDSEYSQLYSDDLPALQDTMEELFHLAQEDPEAALPKVRQAVAKYPRHPVFQNYLFLALKKTRQKEEARQLAEQMYENFPEYLYAKLGYAEELLNEKKFEEAIAILDDKYSLPFLYPDRTTFHATEVLSFNGFMARYFLLQEDLDRAASYCNMMYVIDEDHAQTIATEDMVGIALMQQGMKSVLEKLQKPKKSKIRRLFG